MGCLHCSSECGEVEPDVVDAEGLPVLALLRGPECGTFACAEQRIFGEQGYEAFTDDGQHLGFPGGRSEVHQVLQFGWHTLIPAPIEAKLPPQLFILDSQVRDLRLQGAKLGIPAQTGALLGDERRLLHN